MKTFIIRNDGPQEAPLWHTDEIALVTFDDEQFKEVMERTPKGEALVSSLFKNAFYAMFEKEI